MNYDILVPLIRAIQYTLDKKDLFIVLQCARMSRFWYVPVVVVVGWVVLVGGWAVGGCVCGGGEGVRSKTVTLNFAC